MNEVFATLAVLTVSEIPVTEVENSKRSPEDIQEDRMDKMLEKQRIVCANAAIEAIERGGNKADVFACVKHAFRPTAL